MQLPNPEPEPARRRRGRKRTGRDIIFQTVFPGVFLFLIAYYAFVHQPAIADFYCGGFLRPQPHHHSAKPLSAPAPTSGTEGKQVA